MTLQLRTLVGAAALAGAIATSAAGGPRGDPAAVARAEALLEQIGGRDVWARARTLYIKEHAFLRSGEVATVEIWRDFVDGTRRLRARSASLNVDAVVGTSSGWSRRNDVLRQYTDTEFATERSGLEQEPYRIYHRLARADPVLRVELEGDDRLNVYDGDRLLCWFVLDGLDRPISWGNWFDGKISQHWYGPLQSLGDVRLPRWGSAVDGNWRFEYVEAAVSAERLELPDAGE